MFKKNILIIFLILFVIVLGYSQYNQIQGKHKEKDYQQIIERQDYKLNQTFKKEFMNLKTESLINGLLELKEDKKIDSPDLLYAWRDLKNIVYLSDDLNTFTSSDLILTENIVLSNDEYLEIILDFNELIIMFESLSKEIDLNNEDDGLESLIKKIEIFSKEIEQIQFYLNANHGSEYIDTYNESIESYKNELFDTTRIHVPDIKMEFEALLDS